MRPLAWSALRPDRTTYRYGDLTLPPTEVRPQSHRRESERAAPLGSTSTVWAFLRQVDMARSIAAIGQSSRLRFDRRLSFFRACTLV